ncbi:MAG: 50S ribosomal protein L35 [Alphaproteobacteria bacterium]|nr:50S ribosomal protein L35 [Alphaproteobacteria bacterium]
MPKLKTKSSTKGRFKKTSSGRVLMNHAYKRHCLANKSKRMKRHARGTTVMSKPDARIVLRFMPYA